MLPARRYRKITFIAELTLFACIVAGQARAQLGAPKSAAPTAPASTHAPTTPSQQDAKSEPTNERSAKAGASAASAPPSANVNGAGEVTAAGAPSPSVAPTGTSTSSAHRALPAVNADNNASSADPTVPRLASLPASSKEAADDGLLPTERVGKPPESARWLLIGVGVGTTALWYAGAYGIRGLWPSQADRSDLRIPVAGPFIDLGHTGCPASNPNCSTFQLVVRTILVSLDAIGQAGGVAMLLQGAVLGTAPAAPQTPVASRLRRPISGLDVVPTPWIDGQHGAGIGLSGRF